MTRIVLLGSNGQVGRALTQSLQPLGDVIALSRDQCDFSKPELLQSQIEAISPDVIVNAAAYTAVDQAESEPDLALKVNAAAPAALAATACRCAALLVHYSTDYVYDGKKASAYVEEDAPNPLSSYGRSKLAGDAAVMASGCDYLIFRSSWVYSAYGKNFMRTILRLAEERDTLSVVNDQFGAPTPAGMIAEATAHVLSMDIKKRCEGIFESGLFHLTAQGETSWHGFASLIVAEAKKRGRAMACREVLPIPTTQYPLPALRPANSRLSCAKLKNRYALSLPSWQDGLSKVMDEFESSEQGLSL